MSTDRLDDVAQRMLELPELLDQAETAFLQRRVDRHDWIEADGPRVLHLVTSLRAGHRR
jgi:hypothetical protein